MIALRLKTPEYWLVADEQATFNATSHAVTIDRTTLEISEPKLMVIFMKFNPYFEPVSYFDIAQDGHVLELIPEDVVRTLEKF